MNRGRGEWKAEGEGHTDAPLSAESDLALNLLTQDQDLS